MIDVSQETLVTFSELPAIYKKRGRSISLPTLYRWALRGLCGIRLERAVRNGQICTSLEALDRFDFAVEEVKLGPQVVKLTSASKQVAKAHDRAKRRIAMREKGKK